jgi:hypothetical protein
MLSAQTHRSLDAAAGFVLSSLTDPSTFEGGVAVAVLGALLAALIVGVVGLLRRRRRSTVELTHVESRAPATGAGNEEVADLVTGIGQAMMGVREAIELFGKAVLLEDPETEELEENSREVLVEANRRVDEAEARLPRVELVLGDRANEAKRAVEQLRQALAHLHDYIRQPGWGDDWSMEEHAAAEASFRAAREHERRFLKKARG